MKVYVTASSTRTMKNIDIYKKLLKVFEEYQLENTNKYFTDLVERSVDTQNKHNLYETTLKKIKQSDLLIVDVSDQSVTLGVLIEAAHTNNIPVLCICEDTYRDNVPKIFLYQKNTNQFTLLFYKPEDIDLHIKGYFENFKKNKVKFNVFITPELDSYMRWYAKRNNFSKSDFFREILEEKMKNDNEYKATTSDLHS